MTAERFSGFPATFSRSQPSLSTFHLQQLEGVTLSSNTNRSDVVPQGAVDRAHVSVGSARPEVIGKTRDLLTLLTNVSLTDGFCVDTEGAALGATFRFQERDACTTFATGPTHETFTAAAGFLRVASLQASQDDEAGALANLAFTPLYNGAVDPLVHNTGVDFATAPAPAFVSRYYLGPMFAGGVQQRGLTSVQIETGITFDAKMFDGAVFPTKGAITSRLAKITLQFAKLDNTAVVSMFGRAGANQVIYLQRDGGVGGRVAPGVPNHISLTITSSDTYDDEVSVNENEDGSATVVILPFGPIAVNLATTIP